MSRYAPGLATQHFTEGDYFFRGLDLKHDRTVLEQGMVAKSINKRLRTGVAETRFGTQMPADFNPPFSNQIAGSIVYSNPNGGESLLVGCAGDPFVWELMDGVAPRQVPITGGAAPLGGVIFFVQAFDKVLILHGGVTPLEWNGLDYVGGFHPVVKSDPSDTSTLLIPNTVRYGVPFQSRILYANGRDHILMSDVLDYTSYDPVLADFRINAGESDFIIAIQPYNAESVIVFMKNSIHRFSNFTIDPSLARQEVVTREFGLVDRRTLTQVGADIIFLARKGFYRVNQVFENQTISAPVPISDLITPQLEGINWELVGIASFTGIAFLGEYVYCAVPIGNNFPRNIFVYNTVTSLWESVDAWTNPQVFINYMESTLFNGVRRLFGINKRYPAVYLMYEGNLDQTIYHTANGSSPADVISRVDNVNDILETRAYGQALGLNDQKKFQRVALSVRTRHPSFQISSLADGYNEVKALGSIITKDTSKFYIWGHPDFPPSSDPNEPKRQDYYQGETEWVAQDMENLLPGFIDLLPGVVSDEIGGPETESMERRAIRQVSRWCSIRIENEQGRCDILGVAVDSMAVRRDTMVAA